MRDLGVIPRLADWAASRTRLIGAGLGVALGAALLLVAVIGVSANHPQPLPLPLTAPQVEGLSECRPTTAGTALQTGQVGNATTPPDRNNTSSSNEYITTEGAIDDLVIHANADADPKELTLDISGSHLVFDGQLDSRSHAKIGGSWNLFRHGFEYGQRSVSGKPAFDLTGSNNCFTDRPEQEYENTPVAPDGFPLSSNFDPDNDGNILEHFAPGTAAANAAIAHTGSFTIEGVTFQAQPLGRYFVCGIPATGGARVAPGCSGSGASAIMDRNVQGQVLEPGLYFVTGKVKLSASNLNAVITIVSGQQLNVNGSFQGQGFSVFKPYTDASGAVQGGLLFASQWDEAAPLSGPTFPDGSTANDSPNTDRAEDALKIEGSLSRFEGINVATNGRIEIAGEQLDFRCPVMGDRVRLNGSKNYFNSSGCVANPGLTISKTPDLATDTAGTINAGDPAVFTIRVTNSGTGPATNVDIDDTLPGTGLTWTVTSAKLNGADLPATACAITSGNVLHCDVASLPAGQSIVVVVTSSATTAANQCTAAPNGDGGKLRNGTETAGSAGDALADADNNGQVNDPGEITVTCPDLRIFKTPDLAGDTSGTINAGDPAVFTIRVTNNGAGAATNVDIDDTLPGIGLTWSVTSAQKNGTNLALPDGCAITSGNVLHCDVASLPAGASIVVVVTSTATSAANQCTPTPTGDGGALRNGTDLNGAAGDALADADNNPQVNDPGEITVNCPDTTVLKTPDEPDNDINAGDTATFTITFRNLGPGTATGVGTAAGGDQLPAGLTWTESGGDPDGKCSVTNNVLTCAGISLAAPNAGNTDDYSVSVSAPTTAANCGQLNNTVTSVADGDTNAANNTNSADIDVICPDTTVLKTPDEPNNDINAGQNATFTVTFRNLGPGPATGVGTGAGGDTLPTGLTWTESGGDPDGKCSVTNNVLTCAGISLAAPNAGDTDDYSVSVSAPTTAANCGQLNNTVTSVSDGDTNLTNNSDIADIDVICGAIRINKNSLKDGDAVNTFGAVFSVTGAGISGVMSVTDDNSAAAPDEDAAVGRICISGLRPGQTYTVNETQAPPGYGGAAQTDVTVVATAGDCSTAGINAATFTNPPLGEFIIDYNDLGSNETGAKISCVGLLPTPDDSTPNAFDDDIEKYTNLPGSPAPGTTYTCTIVIDP